MLLNAMRSRKRTCRDCEAASDHVLRSRKQHISYPALSTKNPPNVCKYGIAVETRR